MRGPDGYGDAVRTRVAIDVGPLAGSRTGIGEAVALIVDSLGDLPDGPVLTPYLVSIRAGRVPGRRRLPYPAALTQRTWSRCDWPPTDRFLGPVDVVHGTNYVVPPSRHPRVVTVYDCWFLEHPRYVHPDVQRAGEILRRSVARGAVVHASSQATADKVRHLLPAGRVEVIHLGAPPALVGAPVGALGARPRPGLHLLRPGAPPFILFVGTIERRKNVTGLVGAFGRARRLLPDLHLVLAGGPGDDAEQVDRSIASLRPGDGEAVHLLGRVDDATKAALYAAAAVVAYPSLDEGFGFPLLEAMTAGAPLVASTAGSIPEVAGDAAVFVDPADVEGLARALCEVVEHEDVRARLIAAGHARVENFSWATTARRLADLYARLAMESNS